MTCTGWLCFLPRSGRSRKQSCDLQEEHNLRRKPNVNEEYLQTFRTESYINICNKAQGLLIDRNTTTLSSPPPLTDYLLEPRQEIITNMTQNVKVHRLLLDYFQASLEACRCCDTILQGIYSTRLSYANITRLVKLSKIVLTNFNDSTNIEQTKKDIYEELASFSSKLQNTAPVQFCDIHDWYIQLLQRLTSKRMKIQRRLTLIRFCKKVGGIALVALHGAILIAFLVICFHSVVGLVAAPSIVGLFIKRVKIRISKSKRSNCERLWEQIDAAAKGVFILINDLDTMSRMVKRLNDEVEHRKMVADVCVKNVNVVGGSSKCEILKRVMSEFSDHHESSFLEQLEELEEHVYLCFLTVNKSRRLVMQQITQGNQKDTYK